MSDALGILGLAAFSFSVLFFVAVWVLRAAERYARRRDSTVELVTPGESSSFWDALKIVVLVLGLVGLFLVVWLLKRMWEAAA
jgi:hypothetical protein